MHGNVFSLQARVEQAGGQILYWNGHRVMGILAMSRAIGDHALRPYVISDPEVRRWRLRQTLGVEHWLCLVHVYQYMPIKHRSMI